MAGYSGYSKSMNALEAESEGKYPLSIATKIVAKKTKVTLKKAREVLENIGSCAYHHTSKKYNITYYYDTEKAINIIKYGREESPKEIFEQKLWERKFKQLKKKQESCDHDFEIRYRDLKKSLGGGRVASHYRCKKCDIIKTL